MGLIKEPKEVDFSTKSQPWTEEELADFRSLMKEIKERNAKQKERALSRTKSTKQPVRTKSTNG